METATRITITTIPYEGATCDFLLAHGCQVMRAPDIDVLLVTLPYGAAREKIVDGKNGAMIIYRIMFPDGMSFHEWYSPKYERSLVVGTHAQKNGKE